MVDGSETVVEIAGPAVIAEPVGSVAAEFFAAEFAAAAAAAAESVALEQKDTEE